LTFKISTQFLAVNFVWFFLTENKKVPKEGGGVVRQMWGSQMKTRSCPQADSIKNGNNQFLQINRTVIFWQI
jgi:hypothetical protein